MTQTITIKEPKAPATDAQISFLTSLIKDRECPTVAERFAFAQGFLTKGAASQLITEAKAAPYKGKGAKTIDQQVTEHDAALAAAVQIVTAPAFGYYEIDGTVYYWDVTGKDGYPTLRRLAKITSYTGVVKGSWKKVYAQYGSPKAEATFVPFAGKGYVKDSVTKQVTVPKVLLDGIAAGAKPMSMTEAALKGKVMGFCIRCGATLTDPDSIAAGIGPVCKTYWF